MIEFPIITLILSLILFVCFSSNAIVSGIMHQHKWVFKNWLINLFAFVLAIYLTWINFQIFQKNLWPFGIIMAILALVALVTTAAPFYVYSVFFMSYNILATLKDLNRGPRRLPKVEAMIEGDQLSEALERCKALELKYPNNIYVKRLLLKIYLAYNWEDDAAAKLRSICLYTNSEQECLEMVEKGEQIGYELGGKLRKTYETRLEEKDFTS